MQPSIHFDKSRTSAQSPSHTARRLLYEKAALSGEYIQACDVPMHIQELPQIRIIDLQSNNHIDLMELFEARKINKITSAQQGSQMEAIHGRNIGINL